MSKVVFKYSMSIGALQKYHDELALRMPWCGFTDNRVYNAFIAMFEIYKSIELDYKFGRDRNRIPLNNCLRYRYKFYNKIWVDVENLSFLLVTYIRPIMGTNFGSIQQFYTSIDYLNDSMSAVVQFVASHDYTYVPFCVSVDDSRRIYSRLSSISDKSEDRVFGDYFLAVRLLQGYTEVRDYGDYKRYPVIR